MAGALDFLDTLTQTIGQVAGQAIKSAGDVASATIAAKAQDLSPVETTSAVQNQAMSTNYLPWIIGGGVLLVGAFFLLRK
jgi:hypothetical protein